MILALRFLALIVSALILLAVVKSLLDPSNAPSMPEAELGRLVSRARLSWADYGEGIKAALGATPAAQWHGAPAEARLTAPDLEVRFTLEPPWSAYGFGFPILLRDPEGRVHTPAKYQRQDGAGIYTFQLGDAATPLSVPWVELRFPPNEETRVVFDAEGVWRSPVVR